MTLFGIGNDIVQIERVATLLEKHGERFLQRLFTEKEQQYCLAHRFPSARLAGRFSAKEAVAKAMGTGFGKDVSWLDIEILNDAQGKPTVFFSPRLVEKMGSMHCLLSISHCREYATAVALLLRRDPESINPL